MTRIFITLLVSCTLTGCIITKKNLHNIVERNVEVYSKKQNVDFDNISVILKYYSEMLNGQEPESFELLKINTKHFVKNLKIFNISNNYPIMASKEEITVISGFLNDILKMIEKEEIKPESYVRYINGIIKIYVLELFYHEEEKIL